MLRLRNFALLAALAALFAGQAAAEDLKVMSFNVRTITGPDGPNRWEMRKDLFADTIRKMDPDVIGTQELAQQQGDDTVARLPGFAWFGRDRFGGHKDEHMGIFYRKDRLKLIKSGDFWLSDTPQKVASITWGNVFPRMVNWALFERLSDHKRFYLLDTHFPYRDSDEEARSKSANELAAWVKKLPAGTPAIITGDFNTGPDSESHRMLTETFKDAWLTAPVKKGPEATFHNFTGNATKRIDWILYRGLEAKRVETITTAKDGRYPSDHFPVQADFSL
jgi:Metal-dependent hydrolase